MKKLASFNTDGGGRHPGLGPNAPPLGIVSEPHAGAAHGHGRCSRCQPEFIASLIQRQEVMLQPERKRTSCTFSNDSVEVSKTAISFLKLDYLSL